MTQIVTITENLPKITYKIGHIANISKEFMGFIEGIILTKVETITFNTYRRYEDKQRDFSIELLYKDVTVEAMGTLYEHWQHWDSNNHDQPSEDALLEQWIELDSLELITYSDTILTDFDKSEFNKNQFNKRKK